MEELAVAFVDDTNFFTIGSTYQSNMQRILYKYKNLYKAIGGKISLLKTVCFIWKWGWINSKRTIKEIPLNIKINNVEIKKVNIKESKRILGVYICSSLI